MTKQLTVDGRDGPLKISVGDRVCVPHNIRRLGGGSVDDIARIADQFTQGEEGVHVCYGTPFGTMTIVVRGQFEVGEDRYSMVRTVWKGDSGSKQTERRGLPVYERSFVDDASVMPYQHV